MTIHKEGFAILTIIFIILIVINAAIFLLLKSWAVLFFLVPASLIFFIFLASFFRNPKREGFLHDNAIVAPADGTIVAIEETEEPEMLKVKCIQVSIFMSVFNVHINWFPVKGTVLESVHHSGRFMVARLPKSSTENERTTILMETDKGIRITVRQIAGAIARRIVCYATKNDKVKQGNQLGFIKFGSRVDLYLPLNTRIDVKLGQKVRGKQTIVGWFE